MVYLFSSLIVTLLLLWPIECKIIYTLRYLRNMQCNFTIEQLHAKRILIAIFTENLITVDINFCEVVLMFLAWRESIPIFLDIEDMLILGFMRDGALFQDYGSFLHEYGEAGVVGSRYSRQLNFSLLLQLICDTDPCKSSMWVIMLVIGVYKIILVINLCSKKRFKDVRKLTFVIYITCMLVLLWI